MYCRKCGAENADHAKFCGKCGAELVQIPQESTQEEKSAEKKVEENLQKDFEAEETENFQEIEQERKQEAEQQETKRRKNFRIAAAVGISAVLIAGVTTGVYFGMKDKQEKTFQTKIAMADKYLEDMEYEKAEELYLESIKIDPKERKSYDKLAEIYTAQGKEKKAEAILKKAKENGAVAKGQEVPKKEAQSNEKPAAEPVPDEKPSPNSSSQEENKEEEENKGEHTQDQDKIDDTKAVSLETYVDKVLVPKYGKCTAGTYESKYVKKDGEKKIVQPERLEKQKGVLASKLKDFDGDGEKELLVLMLKTGEEDKAKKDEKHNHVYLQMYEKKEKSIKLAAEYLALRNVMGNAETERQGIFLKESGGKIYICGSTANQYSLTARSHEYGMFAVNYDGTFREYASTKGLLTGEEHEKEITDISAKLEKIGLNATAKRMRGYSELWFEFDESGVEILAELTTTEQNGTEELSEFYETYDSSVLKPVQRKVTLKFDKKEIEAAAKRTEERLKKEQKKDEAYQKILDEYQEALLMGASEVQKDPEGYPNINPLLVFLTETDKGKTEIIYTLYDIDESGEKELLIGSRSNGGDERVVGVYCFDGVDTKNMFEDQTLAERSLLQIYENGTMYIYGSGGASYGNASFYRMDGEHTVIQTEQYTFDMEGHPDQPYYNDKEALSKEAFQKKLDSMGKTVSGLKWKTLSERITGEADPEAAKKVEEAKKKEEAKKAEEKKAQEEKAKKDEAAKKKAEEAKKKEAETENAGQSQEGIKTPENPIQQEEEQTPVYSDLEIQKKLEEYYAKGTEDAKGEEMTVLEQESTKSEYLVKVTTKVPGNETAEQVLYEVTVNKITGETVQKRVLTDGKTVTFLLWEN